jgi:GT2 family glycosyltransferase
MHLAVIIPAYNHLPEVMRCLNTLRMYASGDHVIMYHVQDDCSPEYDLRECVPLEIASTIRNERNLGFGGNCNAGARVVMGTFPADALLFMNQDITAHYDWSRGWDTALLNAFAGDDVGIVGARLLFPNGAIQNAGGVYDQLCQPAHRCLGWTNPLAAECNEARDVDWTTGAAIAVQTNLFQYLGGFDERYERGYFEDVDLCLRARDAGARIRYEPACTLIHSVGSTGGSPYFAQNARRFKQQWVDSGKVKAGTLMATQRYW